jgi:GNAT superfamily N-acetyltransferase
MISIRKARVGDGDRLADLWRELHEEQHEIDPRFMLADDAVERWLNDLKEWIEAPDVRHVLVAETDPQAGDPYLVGFASAQLWWPQPIYEQTLQVYLDELYVTREFRRQGIGTRLYDRVRGWAKERAANRIRLGVLALNGDAISFWKHVGAEGFVLEMSMETSTSTPLHATSD